MQSKIKGSQIIWKRHDDQNTNVGPHVCVTNDTNFEAEDRNTRTGTGIGISQSRGASLSAYGTYPRNGYYHGWDALRGN